MVLDILTRIVGAVVGYLLALAVVQLMPQQTVYPSEENLQQTYKDSKGVCYMYEKVAHPCAEELKADDTSPSKQ